MRIRNYKLWVLVFAIAGILVCVLFKDSFTHAYLLGEYFPLNNGDTYVYDHYEGPETGEVTIRVENVRNTSEGKEFDFIWSGRYNDRKMSLVLNSRGISFRRNENSLKAVRTFSSRLPMMIPGVLQKKPSYEVETEQVNDGKGNLIDIQKREMIIAFIGVEDVKVPAGIFPSLHFFTVATNKDSDGNSWKRHAYDFWISRHIGLVKQVHCFTQLNHFKYIKPEETNLRSRYQNSFVEIFELKNAFIAGQKVF